MKSMTNILLLIIVLLSGIMIPGRTVESAEPEDGYNTKAAMHLSRANILIREGNQEGAEKELRLAVKADPGSEFLRIKLVEGVIIPFTFP